MNKAIQAFLSWLTAFVAPAKFVLKVWFLRPNKGRPSQLPLWSTFYPPVAFAKHFLVYDDAKHWPKPIYVTDIHGLNEMDARVDALREPREIWQTISGFERGERQSMILALQDAMGEART